MVTALRTSLIWDGEVMEDVVLEKPGSITLGASKRTTFVTPDVGLPQRFAVVRPGGAGYLLTLGERMRGTMTIGGVDTDIAEFVRGEPFRATAIGGTDSGVIELDDSGRYKLVFQFVPLEDQPGTITKPILLAGAAGFLLASMMGTVLWSMKGYELDESIFRGVGMTALVLGGAAIVRSLLKSDGESRASFAFSMLLHAALLSFTFQAYSREEAMAWPGPRDLTATYMLTRIDTRIEPSLPAAHTAPTVTTVNPTITASKDPPPINVGQRLAPARYTPTEQTFPGAGLLKHDKLLKTIAGADIGNEIAKVNDMTGTPGDPDGVPNGVRNGTRGGTNPNGIAGEHKKKEGDVEGFKLRAGVCIGQGCGGAPPVEIAPPPTKLDDSPPTITPGEVDRVIRQRAGIFRTCYQKEVNRVPTLAGTLVMKFTIGADGRVKTVRASGGDLKNDYVTQCMVTNIGALQFPAKGGAVVTYPFVFAVGG